MKGLWWGLGSGLSCAVLLCCSDEATRYVKADALEGRALSPPVGGYRIAKPATPTCDAAAATDCGVKFSTHIHGGTLKKLGCTLSSCHGPLANAPTIDDQVPAKARGALLGYVVAGERGKPNARAYVDPCSVDPQSSSMMCNLQGACGEAMPPGGSAPREELDKLAEWLACGAPDN